MLWLAFEIEFNSDGCVDEVVNVMTVEAPEDKEEAKKFITAMIIERDKRADSNYHYKYGLTLLPRNYKPYGLDIFPISEVMKEGWNW